VECGAAEGHDPHPLFDTSFYLEQYPDVAASGLNPLRHYVECGAAEGHDPHPLFDTSFYLQQYPDVAAQGINPLRHYVEYGAAEGWYPKPMAEAEAALTAKYERLSTRPLFSILIPVYNTPAPVLRETLASVCNQVYQEWELCLADDGSTRQETLDVLEEFRAREPDRLKCERLPGNSGIAVASNAAARLASGTFLALLDHDDLLTPDALLEMARRLEQVPEADLLYSDEDKLTMDGELVQPFYKPDFAPELLLTHNYLCHFSVIRTTVFWDVGGFHEGVDGSQDFDLVLRVTEVTQHVEHIPKVLYHWRMVPGSAAVDITAKGGPWHESSRQALRAAIVRRHWQAEVIDGLLPDTYRVKFAVHPTERVTIIIPTKDKVDLLQVCLESIRQHTDHPSYEILVVSNNSEDEATYAYLEQAMRDGLVRFLRYDLPFNYAAINNFAVRHCDSPYVLFLNNDTAVTSAEWLTSMLEFAQHRDIGAVGAKLLYPDNTIQHAGTILGIGGVAGHSHRYLPEQSPGYFGQHNLIRNYSAVTAACLLTRREVWEAVGGFNEDLAVAFNDVDFCLKVRQAGYRIVYTPYARLYHYESASRGSDSTPENAERFRAEVAYMLAQWGPWLQNDPYYNPNLTPCRNDFSLKTPADVEAIQAFWRSFPSLEQSARRRSSTPTTPPHPPHPCGAYWSGDGPRAVTAAASSRQIQDTSGADFSWESAGIAVKRQYAFGTPGTGFKRRLLSNAMPHGERGAAEGHDPHPLFDTSFYLEQYPDVAASGLNPLRHYVECGAAEGRDPKPTAEAEQVDPYTQWVREYDTLDDADRAAIRVQIAALARRPIISIVVPVYNTEESYLREMIESVLQQLYPHWELCLADDASTEPHVERVLREFATLDSRIKVMRRQTNGHICAATNSALDLATGEFVALLDHDDLLSERALYEVALELDAHPDADVVYSDSDLIDDSGRRWAPYFKTDWNPDLMLGHNMVSHLGVYRRSLLEGIGRLRVGFEGSQDYDLMLRAAEVTTPHRIRHVPAILYHWRRDVRSPSFSALSLERCVVAARRSIRSHLERTGTLARVEVAPKIPSHTRVVYAIPNERPLVSVIVPTRDRAELLARCADGVLTRTDYEPLELVIVDNDSQEPETHRLLSHLAEDPRVRIMQYPGDFNYAAINNRAVQEARGDIVVLLNNDVDVISSWWLEEMVSHALRPEVGAVGAKLLYPDGRVQHAGVVLGVGHGAGHFFHLAPREDVGYFGFLGLTRRVSAVTAACMALRRSIYLDVGGLDEDNLPVAFNDVDLCLRIGERGYAVVWTPYAELYHLESATRGADMEAEHSARLERDAEYLWRRWGAVLSCDPYYNPNCSTLTAYFEPGFPPQRCKPWLSFKDRTTGAPVVMSRAETLLVPIDRSARIIEIGPSYNPIAPKADGWNTSTLDHTTRSGLVEKYRGHPGVDVDRIEEVDFVWTNGSVADAVPSDLHGTFDAFIASHVIEHTTDLVGFLDAAATLLAPSGVVILAIPDKRYCFDYFRPLTTTGEVLYAHTTGRTRHTRRILFDQMAYIVKNGENGAWGQTPMQEIQFYHSLEEAGDAFSTTREDPDSPYVDMHAWQFTPASFELLLLELARLGETDWQVERITPPTGCEFYVWLRRGGKAAALTMAEVDARRLALLKQVLLQTREQIDLLLAGEPGPEQRHL
jgi:GT2 family glycosyltransferase